MEAQWTTRPKDAALDVNTSLTWKCKADGVPPITYKWLHNGVKMKTASDPSDYIINKGTLSFPRLQVSQKGMYQCHASNSVKELITAAELDVKGMSGFNLDYELREGRASKNLLCLRLLFSFCNMNFCLKFHSERRIIGAS